MPGDIFGQALHASHPVSRQGETQALTSSSSFSPPALNHHVGLGLLLSFMKIKPGHLSRGQGSMNEALSLFSPTLRMQRKGIGQRVAKPQAPG